MNSKNSDHYFLKGGGKMGELIRATDWSKTSLGDPANWPQSLRTMVAVMLDNPFGMYIAWGSEYIQLYNDGYRPILGATKHPQALGIKTQETFSEIWHIVKPMFDGVMKGTAVGVTDFMYLLNRNGYEEECFFDFSYSPIRKDNGEVGGVLVTVIETTEKKRATEALKESNARFINNIMQAPVAMCIFRGGNYVVEIANEQMLNLWGKHADQVMNKPIFEGLPEAKDQGLEPLLNSVFTTGEKFVANERSVNLPRNGEVETTYINFVYEALKEPDGTISGIAAIAIEVTPQVISRSRIEESEQKVRALVENAPFPIAVYVGKEMIVELANQSILDIWGKGNDVIGKSFKEVLPELDNQSVFEQIQKVLETGESFHTKNTPLDLIIDGKPYTYYFNYSFTPLYDISGNIYGVMNTGVDLTELNLAKKWIEESDKRFRDTMKQAPVGITILRGPEYIVEMANDAYLQLVDKKECDFVGKPLFASLPEVEESVHSLLDNVLNTGIPYHGNEVDIPVNRYGKQDVFYFDFLYHPLKEEDGKISGVIAIVTEVTEKVKARKTIEERKRLYETITQNTPDLIYVFDLNYRFTYANEALLKMWGRTWDDAIGKSMLANGYEPWHAEMHELEIDQVIATKKPVRGEVSFPHATLGERIYDYIFVPVIDQDGKVEAITGTTRDITPQVEARKKIEEAEEKARLAINSAELGVYEIIYSTDEMITDSRFKEIWGVDKSVTRNEYTSVIHPDDMLQRKQAHEKAIKSGHLDYRARVIWKDKSIHWVRVTGKVIYDSEANPLKLIGIIQDITDAVTAREKVEESKEKLNIVIDASELGTYELNLLTDEVIYSDKYLEIFGFGKGIVPTHKELINRLHPTEMQMRDMAFRESLVSGTLFYQAKVAWNDKTIHWIEVKGKVFYNEEKRPVKLIGTVGDITEEKVQKQELQESESKFRLLADSMPQHIWTSDPEGNLNYYNQSVFNYSGLTQEQIIKDGWIQIVHPDDREENIKHWINSITTGKDFLLEHRFRKHDGEYRWQLSRAIPQRDETGKIQMWVGTSTDIQEQKTFAKALEEQVITRTAELKASEEKFYNLFNLSPISKTLSDASSGKIVMINDAFTRLFGYSREEALGKSSAELGLLELEAREIMISQLKSDGKIENREIWFIKKSGEKFMALASAEVISMSDKQFFLSAFNDISEIKKAEHNIKQKNIELEKMNKELQTFAYISSHDLQEPLRKIQTFSTQIIEKESQNLTESGKDKFRRMENAAKRMQTLIDDLLTYSQTNTQERKFEKTNLNTIVEEVKEDLKEELQRKHATIESDEMCEANIIPFQFRQLLFNLVNNSLKFSNPKEAPHIEIKSEIAEGAKLNNQKLINEVKYCHISVSDNGIGFEQQYSEKIFEVFQRLHGKNEYNGTGIGLSIVKRIVENHNGVITAKGELNKGATFDIYIPLF